MAATKDVENAADETDGTRFPGYPTQPHSLPRGLSSSRSSYCISQLTYILSIIITCFTLVLLGLAGGNTSALADLANFIASLRLNNITASSSSSPPAQ